MRNYDCTTRGTVPLYRFLSERIREDILSGLLTPGEKLPSKRAFAEQLGISSVTVENAYHLLVDDGYLSAKEKSGFYVCGKESSPRFVPGPLAPPPEPDAVENSPFPEMAKLTRRIINDYGTALFSKAPHNGCPVLRAAIAAYLRRSRGIAAEPERIVIGAGAEYLYLMIVQLLGRDRVYGLEDPCYEKIRKTYEAAGALCDPLPLDGSGISPDALDRTTATVLHTTPFRSYPSGVTAPAFRRLEYLRWAEARDAILIEDDYASEFFSGPRPPETLYAMKNGERVIYLNTFTRSLAPSVRVAYLLLPPRLSREYDEKLGFYSCTVPVLDQYVLAEYIASGRFERMLSRRRKHRNK